MQKPPRQPKVLQRKVNTARVSRSFITFLVIVNQLKARREFTPQHPEFYALLGIANLSSAVYLVRQRGPELGITGIEKITLEGERVIVHFRGAGPH